MSQRIRYSASTFNAGEGPVNSMVPAHRHSQAAPSVSTGIPSIRTLLGESGRRSRRLSGSSGFVGPCTGLLRLQRLEFGGQDPFVHRILRRLNFFLFNSWGGRFEFLNRRKDDPVYFVVNFHDSLHTD